jgi:hypothetical protein
MQLGTRLTAPVNLVIAAISKHVRHAVRVIVITSLWAVPWATRRRVFAGKGCFPFSKVCRCYLSRAVSSV